MLGEIKIIVLVGIAGIKTAGLDWSDWRTLIIGNNNVFQRVIAGISYHIGIDDALANLDNTFINRLDNVNPRLGTKFGLDIGLGEVGPIDGVASAGRIFNLKLNPGGIFLGGP